MSQRGPPDKHKEAMQDLLNCILARAPVRTSDTFEELAKAEAKLAEHGIFMFPLKCKSGSESDTPGSGSKRAKAEMPIVDPEAQNDAQKL